MTHLTAFHLRHADHVLFTTIHPLEPCCSQPARQENPCHHKPSLPLVPPLPQPERRSSTLPTSNPRHTRSSKALKSASSSPRPTTTSTSPAPSSAGTPARKSPATSTKTPTTSSIS